MSLRKTGAAECSAAPVCLIMVWNGHLSIHPTELPEALKRKTKNRRIRENKKRSPLEKFDRAAALYLENQRYGGASEQTI